MTWVRELNLIRLFEFYLAVVFLLSTAVRLRQYYAILELLRKMPGRWPRLLKVIGRQHGIFLTWATFAPALLALGLLGLHELGCHLLWPQARLTVAGLLELWPAVPFVVLFGGAMTGVDMYTVVQVGEINRAEIEKYFDQAEYWLRPWAAPVVRMLTFGYIDPHNVVAAEVQKALHQLNGLLKSSLWWLSLQTGLRVAFGLSVWLAFACSRG